MGTGSGKAVVCAGIPVTAATGVIFAGLLFNMLLAGRARAQVDWSFSGYVANLPIAQSAQENLTGSSKVFLSNLTRLRLRPTLYRGSRTRIGGEFEIDGFVYNTTASLTGVIPEKSSRQRFDWRWTPVAEDHLTVSAFVDRLYWRQDFSFGNLVAGRQAISWGTGRIWNPTDLFSPINPASFFKLEKDGTDALNFQLYLGNFTDVTLVYNPMETFRDSNGGGRFRTNIREYDLSLVGGYFDRRLVLGGDFAGNLFDAGFRGEGIVSLDNGTPDSTYLKFVLGLDYQFTSRFYALVEYQFNGQGTADRGKYDLEALLKGEIINLSRHYLFLQGNLQLHPLFRTSIAWNGNLNDRSGFWLVSGEYSPGENWTLSLGGLLTYGSILSEYWYYPNALFLLGQYYF